VKATAGVAVAALLLAGLGACGGTGGGSGASDHLLPIALNVALTGAGAPFGVPPKCAWQVVADGYNRAGGVAVGGKRYTVKLSFDDDKWDPTVTRSAIEKEVFNDHVPIVKTIGLPGDPIIVPVTERERVLLIDSTGNKQLLRKPYRYVVGTFPSPNLMGAPFFHALLQREPGIESAYHIGFDLQFDRNNAAWARDALEDLGVAWKGEVFFRPGTVDFTPIVSSAVRADPDLIVLGSVGSNAPAIVRALRQLGYRGRIASDVVAQSLKDIVKGAGEHAANGFYQAEMSSYPATPELEAYRRAYEKRCGGSWDPTQAVLFWTEAKFTLKAIDDADAVDPDAILRAMKTTTIRSPFMVGRPQVVLGGAREYGRPRELATPIALNQFKDGRFRTIEVLRYGS